MNDIELHKLTHDEQSAVLPLLGVCFPTCWQSIADTCSEMPFEEISFGAFDAGKLIAHCGLIPHDIYMNGSWYTIAGIASVAVAPEYRKKGVAKMLCSFAAEWAEANDYALLPLYTEFFRVYEICGWEKFVIPPTVKRKNSSNIECKVDWKRGSELTETEKNTIINIYESGETFNGKIKRLSQGKLQSWDRIFSKNHRFALNCRMYAALVDGVLAEIYFAPKVSDEEKRNFFSSLGEHPCYLPPTASTKMLMAEYDWQLSDDDAMHGERPMIRIPQKSNAVSENIHSLFFALMDKF